MSMVLDDAVSRQARARAVACSILDAPQLARRFVVTDPKALVRSTRRRRHRRAAVAPPAPGAPGAGRRRLVIGAILVAQLGVLAALLLLPTFRVHTVSVEGTHLLPTATIDRLAGARTGQSIFTVDASGMRQRLLADSWVLDATVATQLPGTVDIQVTERPPVLRVRAQGVDELVAAGGATLAVAAADRSSIPVLPVLEDQRPPLDGRPAPLDAALLGVLADAAAAFRATYGVDVAAFRWGTDGVLEIVTVPGWLAILGHVDDPGRIAAVPDQLAALAALKSRLDLTTPTFGYINLENPASPAVGGPPGPPQSPPSLSSLPSLPAGAAAPGTGGGTGGSSAPSPILIGGASGGAASSSAASSGAASSGAASSSASSTAAPSSPAPTATPAPAAQPSPTPVMLGH